MNHSDDDQKIEEKKYYIPVDGKYYEITKEIYDVYYRMGRRERYLEERDIKKGVINFSDIDNGNYSAEEILSDVNTDIEADVTNKIFIETVLEAISTLDEEEKWLIQELFFYAKSERIVASELGVSKTCLHYRKEKVIDKIRKHIKI